MKTKFDEYIKEIEFNILETEYTTNYKKLNNVDVEEKTFISNDNNLYSVYFMITTEEDEKLSDNSYLINHTKLNNIPTIFFSLTERGFGENFDKLANNKEYLEVMGKVVYIILDYIKKHDYTTYTIGDVGDKKIKFYNNYRKFFKDFNIVTGKSSFYKDKDGNKGVGYYLIKNINKNIDISKIKLDENCYLIIK